MSNAGTPGATGRATSEWARRRITSLLTIARTAPERLDEDAPGTALAKGDPIPETARTHLEPLLGRALDAARLHVGREAEELTGALGADAFTIGHHVFGGSQLADRDGKRSLPLLAHELTHVIQQTRPPLIFPSLEMYELGDSSGRVDYRPDNRDTTSGQSAAGSPQLALATSSGEAPSDDLEAEAKATERVVETMNQEPRRARESSHKGGFDPRIIADRVYRLMKEELLVEQERR